MNKIAANVQGFAPGQNEITNYRTLGSVAANYFQMPHCRRGLAQNPLLAACGSLVCYSALLSIVGLKRQLISIDNVELKTMAIEVSNVHCHSSQRPGLSAVLIFRVTSAQYCC